MNPILSPTTGYSVSFQPGFPGAQSFVPSSVIPQHRQSSLEKHRPASQVQRLYNYVGPVQMLSLFAAGVSASFALKWFAKGLSMPALKSSMSTRVPRAPAPTGAEKDLIKNVDRVEEQTGAFLTEGLAALVGFALKNPGRVQERLKAYLGATMLGYILGNATNGVQEVWIRREETQIRADLLHRLAVNFRQSIQYKTALDDYLRKIAKRRIVELLTQFRIPLPEELIRPTQNEVLNRHYRYPYEPFHFSAPIADSPSYRFGNQKPCNTTPALTPPNPLHLQLIKGGAFTMGMAFGLLCQWMMGYLKQASSAVEAVHPKKATEKILFRVFNVCNLEALFLTGKPRLLMAVLGLTAAGKIGKVLVDGYREIEVTRGHAKTELRYQIYNWLNLDPAFHWIAEEEALNDALQKLRNALPYEYNNRQSLAKRIQTILSNIGRNSAPKYFQMTPAVNLVAARG